MRRATVVVVALAFVSIWVVMAAGITAVWLTEKVRLVLYFDWLAKLQRRVLAERDGRHGLGNAA